MKPEIFNKYLYNGGAIIQSEDDMVYFQVMFNNLIQSNIFGPTGINYILHSHLIAYAQEHDLYHDDINWDEQILYFIKSMIKTTITVAM